MGDTSVRRVKRTLSWISCAAILTAAATASGDGGYFGGALGARAAGRSGAFVARADDPTAVLYNPAGIANIGGSVAMFGNRLSYNGYTFTRAPTQDWGNTQNGAAPTVTPAWEAELRRVIELDPHEVGVASPLWTTGLLATYLAAQTGVEMSAETVRRYLHRFDYVCKRPKWTLKRKAEDQEDWAGNACG